MDAIPLDSLITSIAQHLGAVGTGVVVFLVLGFRLMKAWIEYKRAKEDTVPTVKSEELETLIELVAENDEEHDKQETEIMESVKSLTEEIRDIRDIQIELRREVRRLQRIVTDEKYNADTDSHPLDS